MCRLAIGTIVGFSRAFRICTSVFVERRNGGICDPEASPPSGARTRAAVYDRQVISRTFSEFTW